jgi:hypothetical protein
MLRSLSLDFLVSCGCLIEVIDARRSDHCLFCVAPKSKEVQQSQTVHISFRDPLSRLCFGSNSHAVRPSVVDSSLDVLVPPTVCPIKSTSGGYASAPYRSPALGVATTQLVVARDRWAQKEKRKMYVPQ